MARKRNPDTSTILLLGGGAVALFLLLRKKGGDAPVSVEPAVVAPADETQPVIKEQPPVLVEQSPPQVTTPSRGVVKVSRTAGSPAGKLYVDDHLLGLQPVDGIPEEPNGYAFSLPTRAAVLQLKYPDGTMSDKVIVEVKSGLTKTVTIAPPPSLSNSSVGQQTGQQSSGLRIGYLQLSLGAGSPAGKLYINDQLAPQPATGIPVVPATYKLPYAPTTITMKILYDGGVWGDKGTITVEPDVTKTVIFAPPKTATDLIASSLQSGLNNALVGSAISTKTDTSSSFGVGLKTSSLSDTPR